MCKYGVRGLFGAAPLLCLIMAPAQAQDDAIRPLELPVGQSFFTLGGTASGAGFLNGKNADATGVVQAIQSNMSVLLYTRPIANPFAM